MALTEELKGQYQHPQSEGLSPAEQFYLTELYREARNLHPKKSQYHLDIRRPDLASIPLSL